ncbi:MAG: RNA-binding transcriptional accessory protein [Victivallales bacterium]|nr:RNA-binding transcriptional accessory protein [Victivallales bacterium]
MNEKDYQILAQQLDLKIAQVKKVEALFAEGATVPFIARYRKELTGGLDEVALIALRDGMENINKLNKRRDSIIDNLRERELLTAELEAAFNSAASLEQLEDMYLPYKQKRQTRAQKAREKGLDVLAEFLFEQKNVDIDLKRFIDSEKGVLNIDDAFAGAMDIVAEKISEDSLIRAAIRELFAKRSYLSSKVVKSKQEEAAVFRDYFDYSEPLNRVPSHRALAVMRGGAQGLLSFQLRPDKDEATGKIKHKVIRNNNFKYIQHLHDAIEDGYSRLLMPSLENETLNALKQRADAEAIDVFVSNLKKLLLEAPLGNKTIIAVDPGFRTGCKTVVINGCGELLRHLVIYPSDKEAAASAEIKKLLEAFDIEAIAVGNGTAGRETEAFLKKTVGNVVPVISVDESGASIYSAGELARQEFPDLDLTFRSAVSIGRRLQDPLAELIKIDPKSIGVGQYQHDVDQNALKKSLDDAVISCVNSVGVELNSASAQLLGYVSGLGPKLAENIVAWRSENGRFKNRRQLLKVPKLGPKAFEQAAGFLRIRDGVEPLDASAVHPERYQLVGQMARDNGCDVKTLMLKVAAGMTLQLDKYIDDDTGMPTLLDIVGELSRPGRDPRPEFEAFSFEDSVHSIDDLIEGMKLPGIVTNVTKFGAFVDVGIHNDGLLHISKMAKRYISDPAEIVAVHDKIHVTVIEIDRQRGRISLSLID